MSFPKPAWSGDRRSGFTLIEVVVVLLILSVIVGATVPALLQERVPDDDLTAAARRVESLFRLARDSAVNAGYPVTVVIDSSTAAVWLLTPPSTTTQEAPPNSIPIVDGTAPASALDEGTPLDLPPSVQLLVGTQRARYTFLPTGATMADSLVLLSGASRLVLTLDSWTGDVVAH